MSPSPTLPTASPTTELGVPGYVFGDLHDPERLASLYERFCEEAQASDPALWRDWEAYRQAPDAPRPPIALSNLLIAMAPHVSRFVKRLFDVDAPAAAVAESTRAQVSGVVVVPLLPHAAHPTSIATTNSRPARMAIPLPEQLPRL